MINVNDPREYLILDVDYGGSIPEIVNGIERRYTKTMPFLTSIDISRNRLHGQIPETFHLNLSYNNLTGRIPTGSQLATVGPSAYEGNEGLCGEPLARRCPGGLTGEDVAGTEKDDGDSLFPWFYAGIGPGFLVGFIVVCAVLSFVRSF
ncbi:receptor like protein 27, partial [Striga hermonthica]